MIKMRNRLRQANFSSPPHRSAFTVVELLVVMLIIALLAALILGAVHHAQKSSRIAKTKADLAAISTALEQYKSDFKFYPGLPELPGQPIQHTILAQALVGPGTKDEDGADGPGFRVVIDPSTGKFDPNSKKWDAYLSPEHFAIKQFQPLSGKTIGYWAFVDYFGNTIRYFPKRRDFNLRIGPLVGSDSIPGIYNIQDGENPDPASKSGALDAGTLGYMLGDINGNNMIDPDETLATESNFVLVSSGPDGIFNLRGGDPKLKKSDDVFNFDRQ